MLSFIVLALFFLHATYFRMAFKAYKLQSLKLDREQHHLEFLLACKSLNIVPKFLQARSSFLRMNFSKSKHEFELTCLKSYIRQKYAIIDRINKTLYGEKNNGLYRALSMEFADEKKFDEALRKITAYRETQAKKNLNMRFEKKIRNLTGTSNMYKKEPPKFKFINLSNRIFNEEETNILMKGPKHICNSLPSPRVLIPQFEDIVARVKPEKKEEVRSYIFNQYRMYTKRGTDTYIGERKFLKTLREDNNIAIISTDKTNGIAVLNRADYVTKMKQAISDMGCQAVTENPLPKYIKNVERLVRYKSWPEQMKPLVKCNKLGIIPPMFGVLKDHKVNLPMRPIVNKRKSPSYFLEKALVPFLRDILPTSTRALKSTKDFIQKLEQIQLPDSYILATIDIVALYPSIDVFESLMIIEGIIEASGEISQAEKDTVLSSLNLIANNNFFIFDNVVYVQQQGAPMGSPISGLLAEFVLRHFEETCLNNAIIQPLAWFRFVDDIFIIWPDSIDTLRSFYNEINTIHPHLKFTIEYETNASIPYMDVLLMRTSTGIARKVFRKPICNMVTIPAKAAAPKRYKLAAFRSYICRALDVCTPENIHEEFNIIREIGCQNGYSVADINTLIAKITRHVPVSEEQKTKINRVPITYLPVFHERLSKFLHNFDIHLVARTFPKLKDYVKINLDPTPKDARAGVYEIPYEDSDGTRKSYIGMTTRKLETRIKEHRYDVRVGKESTALARVCHNDPAVSVKFDEARVIASLETRRRTLIRESLEIFLQGQEVCNEQSSMDVPNLWKGLFSS